MATQRVGGQIESISWNTADGFAAALNAFVAQSYGAGERERVRKGYQVSLWTVGIWGVLVSAVFICFPNAIADIFFHEPKAVATAVGYLVIIGSARHYVRGADDDRSTVGSRKNETLQRDQYCAHECQNTACHRS